MRTLIGITAFATAAALMLLLGARTTHEPNRPAAFLGDALGRAQPGAALERSSGNGTARIRGERLVVESARGERVALHARLDGRSRWERHANGTWRPTAFGSEAITIGTVDPEHFLTVDRRVGRRTWVWELDTGLVGRLLPTGGVGFVDPKSHRVAELTIAPVSIFDAAGKDVTPEGLSWQLGPDGRTLKLNLNDEGLPEPYVIDPAFRSIGAVAAGTAAATVAPAVPAGVLVGDQLVAFVSSLTPTATLDVIPPAGWTLIRSETSTTFVTLWTFKKQATAAEPGTYTFTFQDPTGSNVNKTSRAIVAAYSGIMSSAPIDGSYGNNSAGASNRLATVPAVSTAGTNRISIWSVANSTTRTVTNPTINAVATTERIDSIAAAPGLEFADAAEPTAFGPATVGTGNVLSGAARWAAQVFSLIPDTTAPTQTLNVNELTNTAGQFFNSATKTHYYNTTAGGTFTVGSVPLDADSGVTSVAFNTVALTGFTHTLVTDMTSPYASNTYTWLNTNVTSPGANRVTVTDRNAQTLNELTITRDVTVPTVFTLNAPTGGAFIKNGSTVSVAALSPTDAGAGVADVSFRACPGSNGCTWADGDAFAVGTDTTDQYSVAWPIGQADGAYQIIARATDNVGLTRDTAAPVNVTLDNTNPAFGTLALGSPTNASLTGLTVYFRGSVAGSFTLSQPLTDTGGSGAASVQFPAIATTGWTHANETVTGASPYVSSTFSWTPTPSTPSGYTLTGADAVGNTPTSGLTFVDDSTVPTGGALTVNGTAATGPGSQSYDIDGTFAIGTRTDYTDSDSGLASSTLTREDGTLSGDACSLYSAPAILIGTPAQSGLATGCYRYVLAGTDNVGNAISITTVVKVDTTDPTAPTLTPSDTSADVHTTGTTAFYRPAGAGSFDVTASSTDGQSGIASYTFPTLAGFTGSGAGATRTYTLATPTEPDGAKTVTANNNAGRTNNSTFTLTADSAVPITGALTVNGTAATGGGTTSTSNGSFSISRTDYTDAISGIATSTLTRDSAPFTNDGCGSYTGSPPTIVGAPAQNLTTGCYEYVLTGTDNVGNPTSVTTVVQVHGAATQIALTGSTANLTSSATRLLTATIRDASGNTVVSDSSTVVTFAKASGAGTVTGTGTATASSGVATKTITGVLTGSVTMEATSGGLTTGTLGAFTVVHDAATQISLTGSTADLTSGANRVLTATIQDAAGNTVTSDNSTVVAFAKASGAGTVTGTGNATASSGVATKTITGQLVGAVTMEATSGGLTTGTLGAFTVVHGAAADIVLTGAATDLTSGDTRVLTATLKDTVGNTVTSDNATVVAFAKASGAGTVTGTGNATASSGVATKTITGALVGSVTMEATSGVLTTGTLGAFNVVHGAAADIVLSGSTADLASGTNSVLTATIKDAVGNTVTSDNTTVVAFAKASGAGTVTGTGNDTAVAGVATKTLTGQLIGSVIMEATSGALTTGTLGAFNVVPGAAAQIALAGSTADLAAGATQVLTATIQDAAGNTVTSDNTTVVAFAKQSGAGSVAGAGNATASSGVATKTITGALIGSVTMEATSGGLTTGTMGAFTVVVGPATQIALTGSTANLTSGATRVLTATIQDAGGNTVTSENTTVVTFAKQSGAGSVTGTGTATASSGVATKTITGALAGSVTMEATAGGVTTGTLGSFSVVHGAAAQIALTGATTDLTSGATRVLTATIQDSAGNTVTSDSTTVVAFAKASGAGTVTGTGDDTAVAGVATKTITGQLAGSVSMEATSGGLANGTLGAFTIVHGAAAQIALTGGTTDLTSGANRVLTATIQDAAGNTVTNDNATVVAFAKASGAGTVNGTGNATAAGGVATKTITGALIGSVTLEATSGVLTTGTLGAFTIVHGAAADIVLTGATTDLTSGANRVLTATLKDAAGNTVTNDNTTVVAFAKASGAGTVTGTGNATAAGGVATKTITGALIGSVTMEATSGVLTTGTLGAFTIVHGGAGQIALTGSTSDLSIGANRVLTATIQDAAGNTVADDNTTVVAFAKQSGAGNVTGTGNATASAGVTQKTVTGQAPGGVTMEATSAGLTAGTLSFTVSDTDPPTNTITIGSPAGAYLSGTTLYYRPSAAGSFTLSSAVADSGAGPGSATYPLVTQSGWTHAAQTVSTPAGGPYVSSAFTWTNAASGDFSYVVTAADAWTPPNTSTTTLNVTEDSAAPAASILCNGAACPAGWFTSSPVSVTLAAPDGGAGLDQIRYTTDGTTPDIFTGNVYAGAFSVASEGVTTVKYRAFDRIGNDTGVLSQVIRIDTVAPQTTIDVAPAAATQDTTPTFEFSSNEGGSTFEYRLDGGSWAAATSPLTLGPLADGTYTFDVRASDLAGNVDASPASFVFTVDTTPANTTITANPPLASNSANASFSFTASDAGPSFECSLDGAAFTDCTSAKSYVGLSETSHTFQVRAEDAAGNVDPTPDSSTWTVDLTAPQTTILTRPSDPYGDAIATFTFDSNEAGSTFRCRIDGGSWNACSSPFDSAALADGAHTFDVEATDAAGNVDATPDSDGWTTDDTNPTGNVTNPANGVNVSGTVALASNSADSGSGVATVVFERRLGAGAWTVTPASWDTTLEGDGAYDLRVATTDNAGNSFTSASITVTVDNTAPSLTVNVDTTINIASPDPETIGATATDAGSGVDYVTFEQCNSPGATCGVSDWTTLTIDTTLPYSVAWPIPTDGVRLLAVTAVDNAGRQTFQTVPVTIDRTAPTTALTAPLAAANLRGTAPVAASASDPAPGGVQLVEFQLTTSGGAYTDPAFASDSSSPYTGSLVTTDHADGLYDLRTFTSDVSGNSTASSGVTVRIDNTPPTGSVTAPTAGANLRGTTVALTSDSADSGSGLATVQFQRSPAGAGTWTNQGPTFDTTGVTDGLYDLRVVTTDNAGNVFASGVTTVRIDNTLPTGSVTSPATGADVRGSITLTSDSADSGSGIATVVFQRSPATLSTWTNQAASWNTTLQADGQYDMRVVTTDNTGNVFTSPTITIRVDNTAPTGSLTAPAAGTEVGVPPVNLTSDSADAGGSGVDTIVFERSPASAGTWTATAASWNTASGPDSVGDGSYDLRVKTTDKAGNSFTSAVVTVLVDHTAPLTSASLAPGSPSNAPVTVSFTAGDGSGSGVSATTYRVDGGSLLQGSSVVIGAPGDHSNDGNHVVQFFSTDDVGNVETPKTANVLIDTTAPSGTPGNPGDYLRGIANLTYSTAATDVSSVQFQFSPASAGAWTNIGAADIAPPYEASWTTNLVADGLYDLRAVVTDSTGNVANELLPGLPKTVDNTAPSGSVTSPAAATYVSGSVNVTASATDGAAPPASGVSAVRFEVKPSGAGSFTVFGTQTAPVFGSTYQQALATGSFADGPADLQVVVTDVAGNETTSASRTINIDNVAPTVTLDDPGAALSNTVTLGVTAAADTAQVVFEHSLAGANSWTAIGTDNTPGDGFSAAFNTNPLADGLYDLRATATDGGGNSTTSALRTTRVDNTLPTGNVTAPGSGAAIGGPAVQLAATAGDIGGSGVTSVAFLVKLFGSGSFNIVGTDTTAPYAITWDATGAPDGATEIRATITDAAGNVRTTPVIPVNVDSTGPSVTLTDPGAVLSDTVGLNVTTGGGAVSVVFGVSPAGGGTWTYIGSDTSAPFGTSFDTRTVPDGLYDLRAIGYDSLGNASTPSVRANVRFDNIAPTLVSSAPADGSVSVSANQIVLTASEPVTAPGAELDGVPAPAPTVSGSTLTFVTGALSDGLHVLSGELEDASGTRTAFRVAVTIESTPSADPPPVERSITSSGNWTMTTPGGLVTVKMPQSAWPTPPTPQDYILVLRVDAGPSIAAGAGFAPGTQIVEVTARWAIAGTYVTEFQAPLEIIFSNPTGVPVIPASSANGTSSWNTTGPLESSTLPAVRRDGFYRDLAGVHVLTRHLTFFGLMLDGEAPSAPRHIAGVVAGDGLTIRWIPGTDSSGQLGNVLLYVNGEDYRFFGPTEYEAKLGAFSQNDTRTFTLAQLDAAGNISAQTPPLRGVPQLAGLSLERASAALVAAGFSVGSVREETSALHTPGTVIDPTDMRLAVELTSIDLVVARAPGTAPQTRLLFSVAGAKKVALTKRTTIAVRVKVSRPANVTATLFGTKKQRLQTWRLKVKAGANVVKLRLPTKIRRTGIYTISLVARSGTETIRRTIKVKLVSPKLAQVQPRKLEVVLAGEQPVKGAPEPKRGVRVVARATPDETFALVASAVRNVGIVVVDVDAYGLGFVSDLRTIFPSLRLIAIAREPAVRRLSIRAGAVLALPRSTSSQQLAKAIVRIAGR